MRHKLVTLLATTALCASNTALLAQGIITTDVGSTPLDIPAVTDVALAQSPLQPSGPIPSPAANASHDPDDAKVPDTPITTLTEALKRAYRTNPHLLAQRAQLRGTDYRLPQARAGYGPKLEGNASYGYERYNSELLPGQFTLQTAWSATATAVITQPLYTFGRSSAAELNAHAQITFGRNSLRSTEAKVLLDTIIAYSVLARDIAGVGIAHDNLALLQREYADTGARLHAREATSTDYQQVESRVGLGTVQLHFAKEQEASSRAEFLRIVGVLPGALAPPNPFNLTAETLEEAYAFAEHNSPVLAAAYGREKVSRAAIDSARAETKPRVDLRGQATTGTVYPYNGALHHTTLRGEVVLSAPIFQSGLLRARIDEAREANQSDWYLIDAALRDNRAEVAEAWNAMVSRHAAIAQFRAAVESAQQAYDGAVEQERAGMRTTLDVLDLARELLTVRTGLNGAITDSYVAEARLLSAMGALEGSYLLSGEELYDPDTHYNAARGNGDVPLLTPLIRSLDGIGHSFKPANRPIRDQAGPLTTPGVKIGPLKPLAVPPDTMIGVVRPD